MKRHLMNPANQTAAFRLSGLNLFLTYPRCSVDPKVATQRIWEKLNPKWSIVCREKHKEGEEKAEWATEMHLHAAIRLRKKIDRNSPKCMDFITGTHGNYQASRSMSDVVVYVTKGNDYVAKNINVETFIKAIKHRQERICGKCETISKMIEHEASIDEINDQDSGYFMMHQKQILAYKVYWAQRKRKEEIKPEWKKPRKGTHSCVAGKQVIEWLCANIKVHRAFKSPQLWLYGPKNTGKTGVVRWLEKYLRIYDIPPNDWDDLYDDEAYDLAFFDEFKGSKKITYMNKFVQGGRCPLLRKNLPVVIKQNNMPVIILSNLDIQGSYPNTKPVILEALEERFLQVELEEGDFLDFYRTKKEKEIAKQKYGGKEKRKRKTPEQVGIWNDGGQNSGPIYKFPNWYSVWEANKKL